MIFSSLLEWFLLFKLIANQAVLTMGVISGWLLGGLTLIFNLRSKQVNINAEKKFHANI